MGLDTGALGPRICDRSSRGHPGMGTRVSIHRTACLSDLVRQRPLSASRGETRCDTYRNRQLHASHICILGRPGNIPEYWPRRDCTLSKGPDYVLSVEATILPPITRS